MTREDCRKDKNKWEEGRVKYCKLYNEWKELRDAGRSPGIRPEETCYNAKENCIDHDPIAKPAMTF